MAILFDACFVAQATRCLISSFKKVCNVPAADVLRFCVLTLLVCRHRDYDQRWTHTVDWPCMLSFNHPHTLTHTHTGVAWYNRVPRFFAPRVHRVLERSNRR